MTVITPDPFVLKDCLVKFGATNQYEAAVTSITLTPTASVVSQAAVAPGAVYSDTSPAIWTLVMSFLQDWADATSLGRYLFDNEGDTVTLTFEPITGDATITVDVVVTPGSIGGDVGAYTISTVTLGCKGKPVIGA